MNTRNPTHRWRVVNRILLLIAGLVFVGFVWSLFTDLRHYESVDEQTWILRYENFGRKPWAVPLASADNPVISGVANRMMVGLPGYTLKNHPYMREHHPKLHYLVVYRAIQLAWFCGIALLINYLIAGLIFKRWTWTNFLLLLTGTLTFCIIPQTASMARIINYDTTSTLLMMLAIVIFLRLYRALAHVDFSRGKRKPISEPLDSYSVASESRPVSWRRHVLFVVLSLLAGMSAGFSFSAKLYGVFAIAFIWLMYGLLPFRARHYFQFLLYSFMHAAIFCGGVVLGIWVITISAWNDFSVLAHYFQMFQNVNMRPGDVRPLVQTALGGQFVLITAWYFLRPVLARYVFNQRGRSLTYIALFVLYVVLLIAAVRFPWRNLYVATRERDLVGYPFIWETAHIFYTFGYETLWVEYLYHFSVILRTLVWVTPEFILILVGYLLWRNIRLRRSIGLDAIEILLFLFILMCAVATSKQMVFPHPRYLMPAIYGIGAFASYVLMKNFRAEQKVWTALMLILLANVGVIMWQLQPHYYGFTNVLRNRQVDNHAEFRRLETLYYGWGMGVDMVLDWMNREGLLKDDMVIKYDYGREPLKLHGKRVRMVALYDRSARHVQAEYVIYTIINTFRNQQTANIIQNRRSIYGAGYLGDNHTYLYEGNQ